MNKGDIMKILITGGAGFVGANLAFYLKERGHDVIAMDNLVRRGSEFNLPALKERGITFIHGDVRCPEDFEQLPRVDFICECSAQPSATEGYKNPMFDITNNTVGLLNVLEFARKNGSAVIYWSTNKVYSGDIVNSIPLKEFDKRWNWDLTAGYHTDYKTPVGFTYGYGFSNELTIDGGQHSIYGLSKVMGDLMCQEYFDAFGVKTVINRFSCLYGPRQWGKCEQGWVTWFAIAYRFNLPLTLFGWNGKQVRDALYISDICNLVDMEMKNIDNVAGQAFNIGGGGDKSISLLEACDMLAELTGNTTEVTIVPNVRKADHCVYISDIRKIKKYIGWEPIVGIKQGYVKILKWIEDNKDMLEKLYK
jgi:CDP-paratose 2-epimerase